MDARHYYPDKLAKLREDSGLSQGALAELFGVVRITIIRAEKGKGVSFGLLSKYAEHFGVAVTKLLRPRPEPVSEVAKVIA